MEYVRLGDVLVKQTPATPSVPTGRTTISFPTGTAKELLKRALIAVEKCECVKPKKRRVVKKKTVKKRKSKR